VIRRLDRSALAPGRIRVHGRPDGLPFAAVWVA
jgi:hypothetical protein